MLAAMLAAMLMLLSGCATLDSGVIVEKKTRDPYVTYVYTGRVMVPVHYPETFHLVVQGTGENEMIKSEWSVSERVYNAYEVGDFIDRENK